MSDYTVLVLGAGASLPYGLPLGKGLVEKICEILPSNDKNRMSETASMLYETLTSNQDFRTSWSSVSGQDFLYALISFRQKLIESDPKSIDEFLARDFGEASNAFRLIGKLSIAYVIAQNESPFGSDFEAKIDTDHWYRYLWQDCLNAGCQNYDAVKTKKIKIISFNYDRSLEYYLGRKLAATYFSPPGTIFDIEKVGKWANSGFKSIETDFSITHPYGTLGSLTKIPYGGANNHRDFGKEMASNIKVIGEDRSDADSFSKAREWLTTAKRIVFLGFSYDQTNMERLGLEEGLPSSTHTQSQSVHRDVNPMTYGFESAERNVLISKYFAQFVETNSRSALHEISYHASTPITRYLRRHGGLAGL